MNSWTELQNLLDSTYRWVGQVKSFNTDSNKINVQIPNTAKLIAVDGPLSEYSIDDFVFIENSTIVGKAPELRTIAEELLF